MREIKNSLGNHLRVRNIVHKLQLLDIQDFRTEGIVFDTDIIRLQYQYIRNKEVFLQQKNLLQELAMILLDDPQEIESFHIYIYNEKDWTELNTYLMTIAYFLPWNSTKASLTFSSELCGIIIDLNSWKRRFKIGFQCKLAILPVYKDNSLYDDITSLHLHWDVAIQYYTGKGHKLPTNLQELTIINDKHFVLPYLKLIMPKHLRQLKLIDMNLNEKIDFQWMIESLTILSFDHCKIKKSLHEYYSENILKLQKLKELNLHQYDLYSEEGLHVLPNTQKLRIDSNNIDNIKWPEREQLMPELSIF